MSRSWSDVRCAGQTAARYATVLPGALSPRQLTATHERARELPSALGTSRRLSDEGGGHEKAQGDAPRTARRAYHASSMGGDPPRRPSSREGAARLPPILRALTQPMALQVLQRAVQRPVRRIAQVDRLLALAQEPKHLREVNRVGSGRRGGRPAQRTVRGPTGIPLPGGATVGS